MATSSPQEPKTLQTIPKMFRDWVHLVTSTWQPLPFAKAPTTKTTMNPSKVDGNGGESYHKRPVGLKQTCPRLFSLASLQLLTLRDENFPIKKRSRCRVSLVRSFKKMQAKAPNFHNAVIEGVLRPSNQTYH